MNKCGRRKSSPFKLRKTTKGKGRTFLSTEEGAGMTKKGVSDYKKENPDVILMDDKFIGPKK